MEQPANMNSEHLSNKRPRSPSNDQPLPAAKVPRTHASQLQINYLARQHKETIPLVTVKEQLPELLRLLGEYDGVLQRHESMAGNLGACPLGPILLKRFERLFDGPPRILKSHGRDANVTWLDVVEFAQNKPEQFNLEKMRNGIRVCQFYTKQCRVEISEEDFVLVHSGMPQKLIPPQPIPEDEEKELRVIELLDRNLGQVIQLADQVSARARQLIHKMKTRTAAILARRETEGEPRPPVLRSNGSPISSSEANGVNNKPIRSIEASQSPPIGFVAVNPRQSITAESERRPDIPVSPSMGSPEAVFPSSSTQNVTYINGRSIKGASPTQKAEMMKQFWTPSEREAVLAEETARRASLGTPRSHTVQAIGVDSRPRSGSIELAGINALNKHAASVAIPNTPAALMPQVKPSPLERDDGGPFKLEMVSRMESMHRGERILPPCDRCRRLHMDCLKNLTACMGCTKKHAKCSWRDVRMDELQGLDSASGGRTPVKVKEDHPPPSAGSTVEIAKAVEESMRPQMAAGRVLDNQDEPPTKVQETGKAASLPASRPEATEPASSLGKFDVRPPPLGHPFDPLMQRSPSQPTHFPSYSPNESRRSIDYNDHDEGDRLQALAAQVYRSASQISKPQD